MQKLTDLNSVLTEYTQHCARGTPCLVEEGACAVSTVRVSLSGGAWGLFCASVTENLVSTKEGQRISGGLLESFLEEVSFENSNRDK